MWIENVFFFNNESAQVEQYFRKHNIPALIPVYLLISFLQDV